MNTIDDILNSLKESAESKNPLPAHRWVDAALSLNSLIGDLHDEMSSKEQEIAKTRVKIGEENPKMPIARINDQIEASDIFREVRRLGLKIKQVEEFIRLAKVQARLKDNELMNY